MISKFFIERPVLANVIAVLMVVIGLVACSACRSRNIPTWCRRRCRSRPAIPAPAPAPSIDTVRCRSSSRSTASRA
jgi:HAE1 family hydrophobic/amphiphilic exporter-1